jgi:hypothetical protein
MSINRYAAKRDKNEPDIIRALEALGCKVWPLSQPRIPDLLVLSNGTWYLLEVKEGRNSLTEGQELFIDMAGAENVGIVRTPEQALAWVGLDVVVWDMDNGGK